MNQRWLALMSLCLLWPSGFAQTTTQVVARTQTAPLKRTPVRQIDEPNQTRIIIASDQLFKPGRSEFKRDAGVILSLAGSLVMDVVQAHATHIQSIDVVAGLDRMGRTNHTKLADHQASHVAAYLWHLGISDQIIHLPKHVKPVSDERMPVGMADNRRVEIRIHLRGRA